MSFMMLNALNETGVVEQYYASLFPWSLGVLMITFWTNKKKDQ